MKVAPPRDGFARRVAEVCPEALHARGDISLVELNLGLRCNMACAHCHQASSPTRTEEMSAEVFGGALDAIRRLRPSLVDITGGAPELHPRIREFVNALYAGGLEMQVRTNLTVFLEPGLEDLPELFAERGVRLLASLPSWEAEEVARQRGGGDVLARSVAVMRGLNALGYGCGDGLRLDLAYNPLGTELPGRQSDLEARFRTELLARFGVTFDSLIACANVATGRFRSRLREIGEERAYLELLREAFNPDTVPLLSCREQVVIAWDGTLWDCDYNLGARLRPTSGAAKRVDDLDAGFARRRIAFGPHCFACTARSGSS